MTTNSDDGELSRAYDAAIEPTGEALQNFARLHQELFKDGLSINHERFIACWIASVLREVGIDLERAVQSLADDNLTLHDDPTIEINWQRRQK
jgi:hypothetical protein